MILNKLNFEKLLDEEDKIIKLNYKYISRDPKKSYLTDLLFALSSMDNNVSLGKDWISHSPIEDLIDGILSYDKLQILKAMEGVGI